MAESTVWRGLVGGKEVAPPRLTSEFSGPERVRWNDQLGAEVDDAIHCAGETRDMGARLSRAERGRDLWNAGMCGRSRWR